MMSFLLSFAMGGLNWLKGLPWQAWAAIAAVALCGLSYCAGERSGKLNERDKWEERVSEIRAERDKAMRDAAESDRALQLQIDASIDGRRKELDDETADIPDQELTARQCARVAQQLRIAGRGRELSPACARKLAASPSE